MYCFKHYIKTFNTKVLVVSKIHNPLNIIHVVVNLKLKKKQRKGKIIRASLVDKHIQFKKRYCFLVFLSLSGNHWFHLDPLVVEWLPPFPTSCVFPDLFHWSDSLSVDSCPALPVSVSAEPRGLMESHLNRCRTSSFPCLGFPEDSTLGWYLGYFCHRQVEKLRGSSFVFVFLDWFLD